MTYLHLDDQLSSNFLHSSTDICFHIFLISDFNLDSYVIFFYSNLSFIKAHIFSIGFKSGEYEGQFFTHEISSVSIKVLVNLDECLGSLSWYSIHFLEPNILFIEGNNYSEIILQNSLESIISVNNLISVKPYQVIPPHTWTLAGCFTL